MKSLPHHLTICFPQIAPLKVKNSWKKMTLAPLSSSWRFKSLSPLQTTQKWRIPGAKLGSGNGAPEGPHGERASPEASSRTESLCQTPKINDVSSQQTSLIHFCCLKSGYLKQTLNKNTFFVYKALLSKWLSLKMALPRWLRPLDAEGSFGNAPGWLQDTVTIRDPGHPAFHKDPKEDNCTGNGFVPKEPIPGSALSLHPEVL